MKGQNTVVKVDALSNKKMPVVVQWDQVTFPDNWNLDIHPTLANENQIPSTMIAHHLGHTNQYKIVSTRSPKKRAQLLDTLLPASQSTYLVHSEASSSARPIAIPLQCTHAKTILIATTPRCTHCHRLML